MTNALHNSFDNLNFDNFTPPKTIEIDESWIHEPEVPVGSNFLSLFTNDDGFERLYTELPPNIIDRPWTSKGEYLKTHFQLLREDSLRPLMRAVAGVMKSPKMNEPPTNSTIGIYDHVFINAFTFSMRGIGARVTFSLNRVGKNIRWMQSKRLISGSLVALIPREDPSVCTLAVVAARTFRGLEKNPPEIHLFFGNPTELEIDSQKEFIMVEERAGFYEAERHTLVALQNMTRKSFPLSEHIIQLQHTVLPPEYLSENPIKDFGSTFQTANLEQIDILRHWPQDFGESFDASQLAALERMLTKRLAIVQGPPGTGKTHVSVQAIQVLVNNMRLGDAPIILTCHTNHALDQLLRHVGKFEGNFVRLGGRSTDNVVMQRTLFEVRKLVKIPISVRKKRAKKDIERLQAEMTQILRPLEKGCSLLDVDLLQKLRVLTDEQCESLRKRSEGWVDSTMSNVMHNPLRDWLGSKFVPAKNRASYKQFFEFEKTEFQEEDLEEFEAENFNRDDEDEIEMLRGETIELSDTWTGAHALRTNFTDKYISGVLKTKNMWDIKSNVRGAVYSYIQRTAKEIILRTFRTKAIAYAKAVEERKAGLWEENSHVLKTQKIIGVTITGYSKYRTLLENIKPKIVLVEEAAEALEAPVIALCVDSLEHLILVGDHKQLKPHCHFRELEDSPHYLNVSLFERLVKNQVEFTILRNQRRMIPEISKLLQPVYGIDIKDHAFVLDRTNRPRVPGMGKLSSYFLTHEYPESRDDQMSCYNSYEADMIIAFIQYLVQNGVQPEEIGVLTFYNGQRKIILNRLQKLNPRVTRHNIHVGTVDSYQGEENGIIILSLVRSNRESKIGFLDVANRVTVAMSRAQRGFYVFGNFELLAIQNTLWGQIITIMYRGLSGDEGVRRRIGYYLPLRCTNHNRKTWVQEYDDWFDHSGGCDLDCGKAMKCGHKCPRLCHPPNISCACNQPCALIVLCSHNCSKLCGEPCYCNLCGQKKTHFSKQETRDANELSSVSPQNPHLDCLPEQSQSSLECLDQQNAALLFGEELTTVSNIADKNVYIEASEKSQRLNCKLWKIHHSKFSDSSGELSRKPKSCNLLDDL